MDVFYQLIGLGALAAMALSFYQKGKRQIMVWQMAAFACFILHYGLIGALSGALCNVVQILSMLLFAARDRFHWPVLAAAIPIFLCYGVLGWYSYESPLALLPVIASLIGMLPFFQSKETVIKIAAMISDSLWLIYTLAVHSYSGALTNVLLIVTTFGSLLVGRKQNNAEWTKNGLPKKVRLMVSTLSTPSLKNASIFSNRAAWCMHSLCR